LAFDRSKAVLVVDDNFAIIKIVKVLLDTQGVTDVDGATSGPEATRLLAKKPYGLIISDFFMIPMNGGDLKLAIDRNPVWSKIPFLLITTREETYDMRKLDKSNIKNVLLKPSTAQGLMAEIDRIAV
jgi:two-component system, chemotaxis family, chemotaxis protein CheY